MIFEKILLFLLFQIPFSKNQIVTTYGHYIIRYFDTNDSFCINEPISTYSFPVDSIECIEINDTFFIQFRDWDSYSNSLRYYGLDEKECPEEIDEDENNFPTGSFVCNGQCLKNYFNDSYYLCYYNNIINSAIISISEFEGKGCKSYNIIYDDDFSGKKLCWMDYENYSLLPLFWNDDNKRLYYQEFNHSTCYGGFIDLEESFFICNGKCHEKQYSNGNVSYKCNFHNLAFFVKSNFLINFFTLFLLLF